MATCPKVICHQKLHKVSRQPKTPGYLKNTELYVFLSCPYFLPVPLLPATGVVLVALWKISGNWGQGWNNLNFDCSAHWEWQAVRYAKDNASTQLGVIALLPIFCAQCAKVQRWRFQGDASAEQFRHWSRVGSFRMKLFNSVQKHLLFIWHLL